MALPSNAVRGTLSGRRQLPPFPVSVSLGCNCRCVIGFTCVEIISLLQLVHGRNRGGRTNRKEKKWKKTKKINVHGIKNLKHRLQCLFWRKDKYVFFQQSQTRDSGYNLPSKWTRVCLYVCLCSVPGGRRHFFNAVIDYFVDLKIVYLYFLHAKRVLPVFT